MADTFETVIGLECHVELSTDSKMFCGCRNAFGAPPNSNVCPVCLGLPGSLPVPNEQAIESIVRIGIALDSTIASNSLFHRKNYFYPAMPKDYQISQYDLPVCVGGRLEIEVDGSRRLIGITRVHMEEDTGKTTHVGAGGRIGRAEYALVDYNRAGVPLVECVSEPDMRSAEQARAYFTELRATLVQETRHFDEETGATHTLRSKEEAFDYRYFPEPDLPPLAPDRAWVERLRGTLPMLPAELRSSYVSQRGLTSEQARLIAGSPRTAWFFDQVVSLGTDPRSAANWITQDLAGLLNTAKVDLAGAKVKPQHIADLVRLVADGTISATGAKQVLEEAFETGDTVEAIVERRGLRQVVDSAALGTWVDEAIAENPGPVQQFRGGKDNALNAVLGQVMKKSGGSADPKAVRELLLQRLSGS